MRQILKDIRARETWDNDTILMLMTMTVCGGVTVGIVWGMLP